MHSLFRRNLYPLLIIYALCIGCHQSHENLLGTWRGFYNDQYSSEADPSVAYTLNKVELQIEPHTKFTFTQHGLVYTGEYNLSGKQLTLNLRTLMGRPLERALLPSANHPTTFRVEIQNDKLVFCPDKQTRVVLNKINP